MSLNDIQLRPQLLAGLYACTLIETNATTMPDARPYKYLGNNLKNITLVVDYNSVPFLPDEELSFLTSILSACKLSLADLAIININKSDTAAVENALRQLNPASVLLFGVDPLSLGLPINFPHFQLQQFDKRKYLYSPSLSELENDKGLKTKLWNCLKVLFHL
jgi:hypothetical protein